MNWKNMRICFWTTAVQGAMVNSYAERWHVTRSYAVSMIVRRYFEYLMTQDSKEAHMVAETYQLLMKGRMSTAKELAASQVDKGLAATDYDEVPW